MVKTMQQILVFTKQFSQLQRATPLLKSNRFSVDCFWDFNQIETFILKNEIKIFLSDQTENLDQLVTLLQLLKESGQVKCFVVGSQLSQTQRMKLWEVGLDLLLTYIPSWAELQFLIKKLTLNFTNQSEVMLASQVRYYSSQGSLCLPDRTIRFRPKENKIFECLTQYRGRIVNRAEIMQFVWPNPETSPNPDTLDVYIRRLRLKLKDWGKNIKTYRGFGYRFELEV